MPLPLTTGEVELEYDVVGAGEPVVFIHGAFIADTFRLLLAEPVLVGRYQLILYRRRGYVGSSRVSVPVSVGQQAAAPTRLLQGVIDLVFEFSIRPRRLASCIHVGSLAPVRGQARTR